MTRQPHQHNNGVVVTTLGANGYGDDAHGFGAFEAQFGIALFSKYPIGTANVRTFQTFLWKDMSGALPSDDPNTSVPADYRRSHRGNHIGDHC